MQPDYRNRHAEISWAQARAGRCPQLIFMALALVHLIIIDIMGRRMIDAPE